MLEFGFRPGNPSVAITEPISPASGVDPGQPQNVLEVPDPQVLVGVIDQWEVHRKEARVLLLIDVSGSMSDVGGPGTDESKLELAKQAAIAALDGFKDTDQVGLRVFSTSLTGDPEVDYLDLEPIAAMTEGHRQALVNRIESLVPVEGTPLYGATADSVTALRETYDAERINAVVLLSDGVNDDGEPGDDDDQLTQLISVLRGGEGAEGRPVRVFPIAYGEDADAATLGRIAEASSAALYDASDPTTIDAVLTAVVSNF